MISGAGHEEDNCDIARIWCQKKLSVTNFDLNYLQTGKIVTLTCIICWGYEICGV